MLGQRSLGRGEVLVMKAALQLHLDLPFKAGRGPAPRAVRVSSPAPTLSQEADWSCVCTFLPESSCVVGKCWLSQDILPVGSLQSTFRKIHVCPGSRTSWLFLLPRIPSLSLSTWQTLTEFPCVRADVNKSMKTFSDNSSPPPCPALLPPWPRDPNSILSLNYRTPKHSIFFQCSWLSGSEAKVWGQYRTRLKPFLHHSLNMYLGQVNHSEPRFPHR